jgi:hypothetical protein
VWDMSSNMVERIVSRRESCEAEVVKVVEVTCSFWVFRLLTRVALSSKA